MAQANGWDVISYKIEKPPFHFSGLDELDLKNIDFQRLKDPKPAVVNLTNASRAVVSKINDTCADFRGLRAIRDLRQILVSAYFHHRAKHSISSPAGFHWDRLAHDRPILQGLSVEDGLIYELDNITGQLFDEQILSWQPDPRVMEVRLEHLTRGREEFHFLLSQHLDAEIPPIDWGNPRSDSGANHWADHFTPKVRSAFKERYGDALIKLGYEKDMDW